MFFRTSEVGNRPCSIEVVAHCFNNKIFSDLGWINIEVANESRINFLTVYLDPLERDASVKACIPIVRHKPPVDEAQSFEAF